MNVEAKASSEVQVPVIEVAEISKEKPMKHTHRALIDRAALGMPVRSIARDLEMSEQHVRKLLRDPEIQQQVESKAKEGFREMAKVRLESLAGKAISTLEEIMEDDSERASSRGDAARYVLDHVLGKPKQPVDHSGNFLIDFRRWIAESRQAKEASMEETIVDRFLAEHVGGSPYSVGKKAE